MRRSKEALEEELRAQAGSRCERVGAIYGMVWLMEVELVTNRCAIEILSSSTHRAGRQEGARTQEQGDEGEHTQEAAAAAERRERIRAVLAAHIVSCSPEPPSPQGGHMPQCAHEAQDHGAQHEPEAEAEAQCVHEAEPEPEPEAAVVQPEPESVPQVQHQAEEQAAPKEVERGSAAQAYLQGLRAAQQHVNIKTVEARLVRVCSRAAAVSSCAAGAS